MQVRFIMALGFMAITELSIAQIFTSEKSFVSFFSAATIENITAENRKSTCLFNAESNEIAVMIQMKDFVFEKNLMQEHFNEKYMESEKYPKATFQGKLNDYKKDAVIQQIKATGKLTIHGVSKDVEIVGSVESSGSKLLLKSKFIVVLEDYNITRPQIMWQNIAEKVEVSIDFSLKAK